MYHINSEYRLREEEDGAGLLFNRSKAKIYVLNPTAMWIMNLLNRKTCHLDEIVSGVGTAFTDADQETIDAEVRSFVRDSASTGFVEQCQA